MADQPDPRPNAETTAVTAGRTHSGDSLAPVLFPSTTYEVDAVKAHDEMVPGSPVSRLSKKIVTVFTPHVIETAEAISASLGHRP